MGVVAGPTGVVETRLEVDSEPLAGCAPCMAQSERKGVVVWLLGQQHFPSL